MVCNFQPPKLCCFQPALTHDAATLARWPLFDEQFIDGIARVSRRRV